MATATARRPQAAKRQRDVMERAAGVTGRIDRQAGVIHGVKVLGRVSKNGHTYSNKALEQGRWKYEGAKVYVDHPPDRNAAAERSVSDLAGVLENVVIRKDGLYGDLSLLKSHPKYSTILEIAERRPGLIGLSHNAVVTESVDKDGGVVFEGIDRVRSVDLVTSPATTKGIFESDQPLQGIGLGYGKAAPAGGTPGDVTADDGPSPSDGATADYLWAAIETAILDRSLSLADRKAKVAKLMDQLDDLADVQESIGRGRRRRPARGKNALESGGRLPKTHAELKAATSVLLAPAPTTPRRGKPAVGGPRNHAELVQATREIMRHR